MIINEIFYSLQGEGFLAGTPSIFIRLAGCPLRCKWCDTKYAWDSKAGEDYSIEKILQTIRQWSCRFVVVTGGEPMINPDLPALAQKLKADDKHITVETAGIAFIPNLACDLMSISPKLSNSVPAEPKLAEIHKNFRPDLAVLRELVDNYEYRLKLVVDSKADLPEIRQMVDKLGDVNSEKVLLMPQATTRDEFLAKAPMIADMCRQTGFVFGQRLQVLLWDNRRGA
jgi:7-carboxy-7-deazaguanine synthase